MSTSLNIRVRLPTVSERSLCQDYLEMPMTEPWILCVESYPLLQSYGFSIRWLENEEHHWLLCNLYSLKNAPGQLLFLAVKLFLQPKAPVQMKTHWGEGKICWDHVHRWMRGKDFWLLREQYSLSFECPAYILLYRVIGCLSNVMLWNSVCSHTVLVVDYANLWVSYLLFLKWIRRNFCFGFE